MSRTQKSIAPASSLRIDRQAWNLEIADNADRERWASLRANLAAHDSNLRKAELQTIISGIKDQSSWAVPRERGPGLAPSIASAVLPLSDDVDTHVRLLVCKVLGHLNDGRDSNITEALRKRASEKCEARVIVRAAADQALRGVHMQNK